MSRCVSCRHSGSRSVAQEQPRVVADVLHRVLQIVEEPCGDPAEHRLALLALDVLLQLTEPVRHRVERVAQFAEFVLRVDGDARLEQALGDGLGAALQREDRRDEVPAEQQAEADHDEERERDGDGQLTLQRLSARVRFARRLLDDDGPVERSDRRGDGELAAAVGVHVLRRRRAGLRG